MNLQTKFFLSVSSGVLAVLIISESVRQRRESRSYAELSATNLQRLERSTLGNMRNLQEAVLISLRDAMEQGEMDRLAQILTQQRRVEGLLECSLIGESGKVAYSSEPAALHRSLDVPLRQQLWQNAIPLERQTDQAFELYRPLLAEKACVECHTDWKVGQVAGVQLLRLSNSAYRQAQQEWSASFASLRKESLIAGVVVTLGIVVVVIALVMLVSRRQLTVPLAKAADTLIRVSQGDLTARVDSELLNRQDEIGGLSQALKRMTDRLRSLLGELSGSAQTLAQSSTELSAASSQSATGVKFASEKATAVARAAEEMSASSMSVAAGMGDATTSLTTVAGAIEQMTATIHEIAVNSEQARSITSEATRHARLVSDRMQDLNAAAKDIGAVTESITNISDQTKLLALNATIEAARAGAAGKGFGVVAQEIKELARQTAEATEDIKARVSGIQNSTAGTLSDIGQISGVIARVSDIVNTIATAIGQQSAATRDMACNVSGAATGVKEANDRVVEISAVSQSVSKDIATVNDATSEISSGTDHVLSSAAELARLAEDLRQMLAQFRTDTASTGERSEVRGLDRSVATRNIESSHRGVALVS